MGRTANAGSVVRSQVDLYSSGITRQAGIFAAAVTASVFVDNLPVAWPIVDGTSVPDAIVSSGSVYFHEISGTSGYYSVRFFPDRTGFWRLILTHAGLGKQVILEFDVTAASAPISQGLNATFD